MPEYRDKNDRVIEVGRNLLFTLEDSVEITGFNKFVRKVEMCFYIPETGRYSPMEDVLVDGINKEIEIIK